MPYQIRRAHSLGSASFAATRAADQPRGTFAWQSSQPVGMLADSGTGTHPSKPRVAGSTPAGRAFLNRGASPLELPYTLARGGPGAPLRSRGSLARSFARTYIEGLRPSNSPTRSLAGAPAPRSALGAMARRREGGSRGSLALLVRTCACVSTTDQAARGLPPAPAHGTVARSLVLPRSLVAPRDWPRISVASHTCFETIELKWPGDRCFLF